MHLVDRHRRTQCVALRARIHPRRVAKLVPGVVDNRRICRWLLGRKCERVGLEQQVAVPGANFEFVADARREPRNKKLPDSRATEHAHHVRPPVPIVEIADDAHAARVGRPHRECRPADTVHYVRMGAELFIRPFMLALVPEILVQRAERRQKTVRVGRSDDCAVRILDMYFVGKYCVAIRDENLEEAVGVDLRHAPWTRSVARDNRDLTGAGPERPHRNAFGPRMYAEDRMRIRMLKGDKTVNVRRRNSIPPRFDHVLGRSLHDFLYIFHLSARLRCRRAKWGEGLFTQTMTIVFPATLEVAAIEIGAPLPPPLFILQTPAPSPKICSIPCIGILIQSGRLFSSYPSS